MYGTIKLDYKTGGKDVEIIFKIIITILIILIFLSLAALIPAIIIDIKKKKLHWAKYVLICFISALVLLFIVNALSYYLIPCCINIDNAELLPLISPAPTIILNP